MSHRSPSGYGLTRLFVQAIIALIIGIVVSICTLLVQIFFVLLGRGPLTSEEHAENAGELHISGCSLCMRRKRLNSDVRAPETVTDRNQPDKSVSQAA